MTMYAVVSSGGKQYRVEAGTTLVVDKLTGDPGSSFVFDRVLLVGDGDAVTIGTPTIAGASVTATVLGEHLADKIVVFKFKPKVKYRRRTGHRQHMTSVRIDAITADGKTVRAEERKPAMASKAAPEADQAAEKAAEQRPARSRTRKTAASAAPEATSESAEAAPKPARRTRAAKAAETGSSATADSAMDEMPKARTRRVRKPKDASASKE
jgi:large subunit ribosomal protein L21